MEKILQYLLCVLLVTGTVAAGCKEKKKAGENVPVAEIVTADNLGYDLSQVEKLELKGKLKEISGLHYIKENLFAAIQDEDGIIFTVDFTTGKIVDEINFGGQGDYEDITMDADFFYVLKSNGTIYSVSRKSGGPAVKEISLENNNGGEFESLYLDLSGENLVIICKSCPGEKKYGASAYLYNLKNAVFSDQPVYNIDMSVLSKDEVRQDIKPSAAAIHPIEKKLYVLCSVGKMLLVCDTKGKVETGYHLDADLFQQPEGIAFTPNGDMYISNESNKSKANILKLIYRSR